MSLHRLPWIFVFLVAQMTGNAQVPGYLGKKITIEPHMKISFVYSGITAANRGRANLYGDAEPTRWNTNRRYGVDFGYVIARNKQLILGYNYFKTGMILNVNTPSLYGTGSDFHSLFLNPTGHVLKFEFRKFSQKKGALAPIGVYHGFNVQVAMIHSPIVDKKTTLYYADAPGHAPLGIDTQTLAYSIGYKYAENILINDFMVLNYGWEFNLPLFALVETAQIDNQFEYNRALNSRLVGYSLFYLNFGIGFIL